MWVGSLWLPGANLECTLSLQTLPWVPPGLGARSAPWLSPFQEEVLPSELEQVAWPPRPHQPLGVEALAGPWGPPLLAAGAGRMGLLPRPQPQRDQNTMVMAEIRKGISEESKWNLFPFSAKCTRALYGVCQYSKWSSPALRWEALPPEVGNEPLWQGCGPTPHPRPRDG